MIQLFKNSWYKLKICDPRDAIIIIGKLQRKGSRKFLEDILRCVYLLERPVDNRPWSDIARIAVSLLKRRSCGYLRVMPALATFGSATENCESNKAGEV